MAPPLGQAHEGPEDNGSLMKEFYRSGASNFAAFKRARAGLSATSPSSTNPPLPSPARLVPSMGRTTPTPAATAPAATANVSGRVSTPPMSSPSPTLPRGEPKKLAPLPERNPVPSPTPLPVERERERESVPRPTAQEEPTATATLQDEGSSNYMAFLRRSQDLQKGHQTLCKALGQYGMDRSNCQALVEEWRASLKQILKDLEEGTDWNLTSRYNTNQLIKDAKLKLQPQDLFAPDAKPQFLDLIAQESNLEKLKKEHRKREAYSVFKTLFDQATHKLDRVEKEIRNSQLDATQIARLPDTLFIQLDHILTVPTIDEVLADTENHVEDLCYKLEKAKGDREQALDDGEMKMAEDLCYDVVRLYETILELTQEKIRTSERIKEESLVFNRVRSEYETKGADESRALKDEKGALKAKCQDDLTRIFNLKERVDAVEAQTAQKLQADLEQSDIDLRDNKAKLEDLWNQASNLEKELSKTELDRFNEFKKRVGLKEKDETRRMEYRRFCDVVRKHTDLLELAVKNCDTATHSIDLLSKTVETGFQGMGRFLEELDSKYAGILIDTHKQHLEFFRGLYLNIGDLIHKKEKKIQEIDDLIQTNHIQQELAADMLNPAAKKFSDERKHLLVERDRVEQELRELKEKAQHALDNFRESEVALQNSGYNFVHPVIEQQEQELETKSRMVEYRAISTGHVDPTPIKEELQHLKRKMDETRQVLSHPAIQAAIAA